MFAECGLLGMWFCQAQGSLARLACDCNLNSLLLLRQKSGNTHVTLSLLWLPVIAIYRVALHPFAMIVLG